MRFLSRLIGSRNRAQDHAGKAGVDAERPDVRAWVRTGYDMQMQRQSGEAQALFRQVLEHDPENADALFFLGVVAGAEGRELEAIEFFRKAVESRPDDLMSWMALGGGLFDSYRLEEARKAYEASVQLQPDSPHALSNLWATMNLGDAEDEARVAIERALEAGHEGPHIHVNLAIIYRNCGRIQESLAEYRRLLDTKPDDAVNFSNLLLTLNSSDRHDARAIYAEHEAFAARFAKPYIAPLPERSWPRRLRIGYVSPDFRVHPVAFFFQPMLERRDRERFEVFCYYNYRADDRFTKQIRESADHWIETIHMSDEELATRIREDRIDILVDLAGHTGFNRLLVFATKPAPVQVTYLGYPNTTGLAAIDYRITDARADPPGMSDQLSAERLVRLPDCFHCYRAPADAPDPGPLPLHSAGGITFGCFNNASKLSDSFLDMAAGVLNAVPGSRLWLKSRSLGVPYANQRIMDRLAARGIDAARVKLTGWVPRADHLQPYREVDIALDSFPYNGTTTTCEALWMGVPVVTRAGDRHVSRVGASLLHAVGLPEFVAPDHDGFIALCVSLASDVERLAQLRATLRDRVRRSPLMDEARFTRAVEDSYLTMWQSKLAGDVSAHPLPEGAAPELLRQAAAFRAQGRLSEAAELYKQVLLAIPHTAEALAGLWDISFELGNPGLSADWLNKAIAAQPQEAEVHYMLGCVLNAQGKVQDAIRAFSRAVELDPRHPKAHNNLGYALHLAGDLAGALQAFDRAIEVNPRLAEAYYNRGNAQRVLGHFAAARESVQQALAIDPARAEWRCNLADMLFGELRLDEALESYRIAMELDSSMSRPHAGLATVLQHLGRLEEAERSMRRAVELAPEDASTHSQLLALLHYGRAEERELLLDEQRAWARRHARYGQRRPACGTRKRSPGDLLHVGYLFADVPGAHIESFIEPVLAGHNRDRFRIFGYSNLPYAEGGVLPYRKHCDDWRDIAALEEDAIVERMRFDDIDVLVDVAGHAGGRPILLARKPAPVMVSWLGYPNTLALPQVDYRLTDQSADPHGGADSFYTEKLVRMERGFLCYLPPADAPEPGEVPSDAVGCVTFGAFTELARIAPMVEIWGRVLGAMPGARLMLSAFGLTARSAREHIVAAFAARGIEASRLVLQHPAESRSENLARYNDLDVVLDPHPYSAAVAACEALWMGVPVVTLGGASHASRVGASILSQVGLQQLIAAGAEDYLAKAISVAQDVAQRRALRAGLRQRLRASPLLQASSFVQRLEETYRTLCAEAAAA